MVQEKENKANTETLGKEVEAQAEPVGQSEEAVERAVPAEEELEEERDALEGLTEQLDKAQRQASEYLEGWQRAQAEFSNYKKRQEAERAQMITRANATLLLKLLPVVDDFERAMATLPPGLSELTWCEGAFLIKRKLDVVLESAGVEPIETEGRAFDPCYHEAVTYEQVAGYQDGQIIGEVQRGYLLGDRVLRPALVRVAKAPESEPVEAVEAECQDKE